MGLLLLSFLAGVLTILAPCVLPLLPIILGSSATHEKDRLRPYIIILSLSISILLFTLLLKVSTVFIGVNPIVWKLFSGVIIILFGVVTLFPDLWKNFSAQIGFSGLSNKRLSESNNTKGYLGDVLVGFSLGPVFSSCSPTYGLILAVILPVSFFTGFINLIAYIAGLSVILLLIAIMGQKITKKLRFLSDPHGKFKKFLGVLFILVGLSIITGFDKTIETSIIKSGYYGITDLEQNLIKNLDN